MGFTYEPRFVPLALVAVLLSVLIVDRVVVAIAISS